MSLDALEPSFSPMRQYLLFSVIGDFLREQIIIGFPQGHVLVP